MNGKELEVVHKMVTVAAKTMEVSLEKVGVDILTNDSGPFIMFGEKFLRALVITKGLMIQYFIKKGEQKIEASIAGQIAESDPMMNEDAVEIAVRKVLDYAKAHIQGAEDNIKMDSRQP
jgi:hypothetical protein